MRKTAMGSRTSLPLPLADIEERPMNNGGEAGSTTSTKEQYSKSQSSTMVHTAHTPSSLVISAKSTSVANTTPVPSSLLVKKTPTPSPSAVNTPSSTTSSSEAPLEEGSDRRKSSRCKGRTRVSAVTLCNCNDSKQENKDSNTGLAGRITQRTRSSSLRSSKRSGRKGTSGRNHSELMGCIAGFSSGIARCSTKNTQPGQGSDSGGSRPLLEEHDERNYVHSRGGNNGTVLCKNASPRSCSGRVSGLSEEDTMDEKFSTKNLQNKEQLFGDFSKRDSVAGSSASRGRSALYTETSSSRKREKKVTERRGRRRNTESLESSKITSGESSGNVESESSGRRAANGRRSSGSTSSKQCQTIEGSSRSRLSGNTDGEDSTRRRPARDNVCSPGSTQQSSDPVPKSSKRRNKTPEGEKRSSKKATSASTGGTCARNSALKGSVTRWRSVVTGDSKRPGEAKARCSSAGRVSLLEAIQSTSTCTSSLHQYRPYDINPGSTAGVAWTAQPPGILKEGLNQNNTQQTEGKTEKQEPYGLSPQRKEQGLPQWQNQWQIQRDYALAMMLQKQKAPWQQSTAGTTPEIQYHERPAPETDLIRAAAFLAEAARDVIPAENPVPAASSCGIPTSPYLGAAQSLKLPPIRNHVQRTTLGGFANVDATILVTKGSPAAAETVASGTPENFSPFSAAEFVLPPGGSIPCSPAATAALAAAAGLATASVALGQPALCRVANLRAAASAAARAAGLSSSEGDAAAGRLAAAAATAARQISLQARAQQQEQRQRQRQRQRQQQQQRQHPSDTVTPVNGSDNCLHPQEPVEKTGVATEVPENPKEQSEGKLVPLLQVLQGPHSERWQQTTVKLIQSLSVTPAPAADREAALFVFDLDDTLIPTEWIRTTYLKKRKSADGEFSLNIYREVSRDVNSLTSFLLMPLVLRMLLKAKALAATVAIVTNARSNKWIEIVECMFPELTMLLQSEEIPIIRSCPEGVEPDALCVPAYFSYWMNAKKKRFEELILRHLEKYPRAASNRLDIISVGDNDFEEYAATFLALEAPTFVRFAKVVRCRTGLAPVDFIGQLQDVAEAMNRVCAEHTTQTSGRVGSTVMYRIQGWERPRGLGAPSPGLRAQQTSSKGPPDENASAGSTGSKSEGPRGRLRTPCRIGYTPRILEKCPPVDRETHALHQADGATEGVKQEAPGPVAFFQRRHYRDVGAVR